MAHSPRSIRLALVFAIVLVGALAFWLSLQISSSAAVPLAVDGAPDAQVAAPHADVYRPEAPAGRENPLVALPADGTPTLTVRAGERVELRSSPGGRVVDTVGDTTEFGSPTVLTVLARRGNWAGVPTELLPNGELGWVKLGGDDVAVDSVGQSIVIDLSAMRAKLLRGDEVERSWQVGIGAPGTPTPTGHFSITDEIEGGLNPAYGCCALALSATQPNLPAGWTGGNRIAIHGTSLPLGEANSNGCVHSGEADLQALLESAPLGTPVTIRA